MAYLDQNGLLSDADFQVRVRLSLIKTATAIIGEATAAGTKKTKRHDLAVAILNGVGGYEKRFAEALVATDLITQANIATDAAYDTGMSSLFDDFAGVSSDDT